MFNKLKKQIQEESGSGIPSFPATHQHPIKPPADDSLKEVVNRKKTEASWQKNFYSEPPEHHSPPASELRAILKPEDNVKNGISINLLNIEKPVNDTVQLSEIESRYKNLENAYDDYRSKTGELLGKKDSHISRLQERVGQLEERIEDLQKGEKLHCVVADRDLLRQKLEKVESAYDKERSSWEFKLLELRKRWQEDTVKYENRITELINAHELERKKLQGQCDCEVLKKELGELKASTAVLEAEYSSSLEKKEVELKSVVAELSKASSERDLCLKQLEKLGKERRRSSDEKLVENLHLRERLGETQEYFEAMDIQSEQHITTLANQVEDLNSALDVTHRDLNVMNRELDEKDQVMEQLQQRIKTLEGNNTRQQDVIESLREEADRQKDRARECVKERDDLLLRNASLSHEVEIVRRDSSQERDEIRQQLSQLSEELESYKKRLVEENSSVRIDQVNEKVSELEEALKDRDTTIRLQQQRLADMKKTLQKELKLGGSSQHLATTEPGVGLGQSLSRSKNSLVASNPNLSRADSDEVDVGGVNFQYLKHVLLRFVTSTDMEATQLVRAVATLLRFSPAEEQLVWDTLRWKTSWLPGQSKPRMPLGFPGH